MSPESHNRVFPEWQESPWPDFRENSEQRPLLALQPVCALREQRNDLPLDLEEKWIVACINEAAREAAHFSLEKIHTLPPFRNVPTLLADQVFGTTVTGGSQALFEIASSVSLSGVHKIAFVHCNQALDDWIDTLARELRIEKDLRTFNINLQGMGVPADEELTPPSDEAIRSVAPGLASILKDILRFPIIPPFTPSAPENE